MLTDYLMIKAKPCAVAGIAAASTATIDLLFDN